MKGYIITGSEYTAKKVYTNKTKAEKACEKENYAIGCSGSYRTVYVTEIEIDTDEEEG